jgi:hypothetical protein
MITVFDFDRRGPPDEEMIKDLLKNTTASKLHKTLCLATALIKFHKNELNTKNVSGDLDSKVRRITKCITAGSLSTHIVS